MERLVRFEVLGQEYPFYTDASEEDIKEILWLVKSQVDNHGNASRHVLPASKLAILASLNMAGKYVKLKRDFEQYRQKVDQCINQLADKIEG